MFGRLLIKQVSQVLDGLNGDVGIVIGRPADEEELVDPSWLAWNNKQL